MKMDPPFHLRIECLIPGETSAMLFEGPLKPKKRSPRGIYAFFASGIQTLRGIPLEVDVTLYDVSINAGNLAIRSSGTELLWVAPLTRDSRVVLGLSSGEELAVSAVPTFLGHLSGGMNE
jgi:hypothetical protein